MLRTIFVFIIITVGVFYAAQGPFYALLFYLWNSYFRPEQWVWGGAVSSLNLSVTHRHWSRLSLRSTSPGHGRIGSISRRSSS
jgi:hypothetical protein